MMQNDKRWSRLLRALGLAIVLTGFGWVGCGGSSGGGGGGVVTQGLTASYAPSATSPAADMVRLSSIGSGDLAQVRVSIGGPTTNQDLYSFAFDVVLGSVGVFELVPGSASFGTALTLEAGQQGQATATQNGSRITVGVTKLGGGSGNGVASGERAVVQFNVRALRAGQASLSIQGSNGSLPTALDSTGAPVPSVSFDAQTGMLTAR